MKTATLSRNKRCGKSKYQRVRLFVLCALCLFLSFCATASGGSVASQGADLAATAVAGQTPPAPEEPVEEPVVISPFFQNQQVPQSNFPEIWAYLLKDHENQLPANSPLTDIGYFSAEINSYGELSDIPQRSKVANFSGRVHLVAVCGGRALSHFVLKEGSPERAKLIADLLKAAKDYDGLQIDFENVPERDAAAFRSFLRELKNGLEGKMFTIALAARTKKLQTDPYDYELIKEIVDRIFVMAYDQHWSGSEPGPVAGIDWCSRVAQYAVKAIGQDKLIMGLPFYGRTWGSESFNRAYYFTTMQKIIANNNVADIQRKNGVPFFTYERAVTITSYFDDNLSLAERMGIYKGLGVRAVGFWCLGQEDPGFWKGMGNNAGQGLG
jgi:hypothetical protein